jgi:hypothetical protein
MISNGIPLPMLSIPAPAPIVEATPPTKSKRKEKNAPVANTAPPAPVQSGPLITVEMQDLLFLFRHKSLKLQRLEKVLRRIDRIIYGDVKTEGAESRKRKRTGSVSSLEEFASARKRLRRFDAVLSLLNDDKLKGFQMEEEKDEDDVNGKEV